MQFFFFLSSLHLHYSRFKRKIQSHALFPMLKTSYNNIFRTILFMVHVHSLKSFLSSSDVVNTLDDVIFIVIGGKAEYTSFIRISRKSHSLISFPRVRPLYNTFEYVGSTVTLSDIAVETLLAI